MPTIPSFNQQELEYLQDEHFLLTKRKIIQQLQQLLHNTRQQLLPLLQKHKAYLPPDSLQNAGKISRGENYRGLPYLILDYPKLFTKENIFAFRTMFWWGNFFSCTLHLQGEALTTYRPALLAQLGKSNFPGLYICVAETPWEYHYGPTNYQAVDELSPERLKSLLERDFCKLSRKTALSDYAAIPTFVHTCLQELLALLKIEK